MATSATFQTKVSVALRDAALAGRALFTRIDGVLFLAYPPEQAHDISPLAARTCAAPDGGRESGGSRSQPRGPAVRFCPDSGHKMKPGAQTAPPRAKELPLSCAYSPCLPRLRLPPV